MQRVPPHRDLVQSSGWRFVLGRLDSFEMFDGRGIEEIARISQRRFRPARIFAVKKSLDHTPLLRRLLDAPIQESHDQTRCLNTGWRPDTALEG